MAGTQKEFNKEFKIHFLCYFYGKMGYYKKKFIKINDNNSKDIKSNDNDNNNDSNNNDNDNDKSNSKKKRIKKLLMMSKSKKTDKKMDIDIKNITLDNPEYTLKYECSDDFIEKIIELSDTIPDNLDALIAFDNELEKKRKLLLDKMKPAATKLKKKVCIFNI